MNWTGFYISLYKDRYMSLRARRAWQSHFLRLKKQRLLRRYAPRNDALIMQGYMEILAP